MNKNTKTKIKAKVAAVMAISLVLQIILPVLPTPLSGIPEEAVTAKAQELCVVDVDVMLVMDISGSMDEGEAESQCTWWSLEWTGSGFEWIFNTTFGESQAWCDAKDQSPSRPSTYTPPSDSKIVASKSAVNDFISNLESNDQSGLVSFSSTAQLVKQLSNNHAATQSAVNALTTGGSTNIGDAINEGILELNSVRANPQAAKAMILLTDGKANKPNGPGFGEDPNDVAYAITKAAEAAILGFKIFTIGLGSNSEINEVMLGDIADITGASYYHAGNGNDLSEIYDLISIEVCEFGSISGCKYIDDDNDGDISGEATSSGWTIILGGDASSTQATDVNGCYTFAGLTEGNYTVIEGVNAGKQPFTQTYPQNPYNIVLPKGHNELNVDFGNYYPSCGNNILDDGEQCDDGNTEDGDGCSAICELEDEEPFCGDGNVDEQLGEWCDDGNNEDHDGCTSECLPEPLCYIEEQEGRTIIDLVPGLPKLRSDFTTNDATSTDFSVNILSGIYDILLFSGDGYVGRATSTPQPNESWQAIFKNGATEVVESATTTDLADDVDFVGVIETVNQNFLIPQNIDSIYAKHSEYDNVPTVSPNSVVPLCLALDYVGPAPFCGDNAVNQPSEQCDDGNNEDGDGCSANCTIEEPRDGSITVCKMIVDENDNIVSTAGEQNTFVIPGVEGAFGGPITTTTFTTSLNLNTDLIGDSANDAECTTYSNLEYGFYSYGEEIITGPGNWLEPLYNDQLDTTVTSTESFYPYGGELVTPDPSDDPGRNRDADGAMNVSAQRPHRTLVVLNRIAPSLPPYCGDGIVNQNWEQCDGTEGCSEQCLLGNDCQEIILAKINVDDVKNFGPWDMTSDIFLGSAANKIPQGVWFLLYLNGVYQEDPDLLNTYEDVPGLAVQRTQGRLRTLMHGTRPTAADREHITGNIEFFNSTPLSQEDDQTGNNPLDNGFNGTGIGGYSAADDEVWLQYSTTTQSTTSNFWLTTNVADDSFYTVYEEGPVCEDPETGVITVCKIILDENGNVTDGAANPGTFVLPPGIKNQPLPTSTFSTPLNLNSNLLGDDQINDAECIVHDNLDIATYYYDREQVTGDNWQTPLYNDQLESSVTSTDSFYPYQFNGPNPDSNGIINLVQKGPTRTLVILNRYEVSGIQPGDIVINEIMQNPNAVSDTKGEWFELYNTTLEDIDLDGCVIHDNGGGGGDSHTISGTLNVPSNGYIVLNRNASSTQNGGITPDYTYSGITLSNSSDKIILTCNQTEIDRVEYDNGATFPDPTGISMILESPILDNNIGANWCTSSSPFGDGDLGTPGFVNDSCGGEPPAPVCGNGQTESPEQCDDGNTTGGDGCSETCQIEQGPPPQTGGITVCKIIIDENDNIVTGNANPGTFNIPGIDIPTHPTVGNQAGVLATSTFSTALTFNANLIDGDQTNDAECITYNNLAIGSYFYGQEKITGSNWQTPLYNDQFTHPVNDLTDFFPYSGELFTPTTADDANRDQNVDGHITLTAQRPNRTLVVLNQYQLPLSRCGDNTLDQGEQCDDGNNVDGDGCSAICELEELECEDIATSTGWYGNYYNYPTNHPDMNLPSNLWPDKTHGDPLGAWNTDWYTQPYFRFSRVDQNLLFGEDFFPFDTSIEEITNGHDYHFGAHWQAKATVATAGSYQYTLTSDDDAWVYVDGTLQVDNSGIHAPITKTGTLSLTDEHIIDVFFAERHIVRSHLSFDIDATTTPYNEECGEPDSQIVDPYCGDGNQDQGEQCDDGNNDNYDGCSSTCQVESPLGGGGPKDFGFTPTSTPTTSPDKGVAGTSTQATSTECTDPYLTDYLRFGANNDPEQVVRLQKFLRDFEGFSELAITGIFNQETFDAVLTFQLRYKEDILDPLGIDFPTGFVYITTKNKINELFCGREYELTPAEQIIIKAATSLLQQGLLTPQQLSPIIGQAPPEDPNKLVAGETTLLGNIVEQIDEEEEQKKIERKNEAKAIISAIEEALAALILLFD